MLCFKAQREIILEIIFVGFVNIVEYTSTLLCNNHDIQLRMY